MRQTIKRQTKQTRMIINIYGSIMMTLWTRTWESAWTLYSYAVYCCHL